MVYKVNLFMVDANGGSPRKLSGAFELNAGEPVWSRDGKTIFFSSDDREAMKVFAVDVTAGTVRPLTDAATVVNLAEISTNGQTAVGTWGDATHPDDVFRSDLVLGRWSASPIRMPGWGITRWDERSGSMEEQ